MSERKSVFECAECGAQCSMRGPVPDDRSCMSCRIERRLDALSDDELESVDDAIAHRKMIAAIRELRRLLDLSLRDAQLAMYVRAEQIGKPITHEIIPPGEDEMFGMLVRMDPGPLAIQATWDGDTQGWMVILEAVCRSYGGYLRRPLGTKRGAGDDMRLFNGEVPRWPEAAWASEVGSSLARRIGVPFHFGSPDAPDDEAPNWWDTLG